MWSLKKRPTLTLKCASKPKCTPRVNKQSKFQKVVLAKDKWWGTILWLDDVVNVTERDEFIYHEMTAHVPMMIHKDPKRVLIIGGGDGGSAREVLRHPNLEKFVMVDIDEEAPLAAPTIGIRFP